MQTLHERDNGFFWTVNRSYSKFPDRDSLDCFFVEPDAEVLAFINHFSLWSLLKRSPGVLAGFDYVFLDGFLMVRQFGSAIKNVERRSFDLTSVAVPFLQRAYDNEYHVLFVGGTAEESVLFADWLAIGADRQKFDVISGFENALLTRICAEIERHEKIMVVLGLGSPLQENLAVEIKGKYNGLRQYVKILTCGGFITQTAVSAGHFYPAWVRRIGVRWLWRCIKQPYVIKRILSVYPRSYFYLHRYLRGM
jgi:UDP-Gal:alpha-D-GlcNAc-diphosphoundecaprenol beta-1,4-galactosyltransferase